MATYCTPSELRTQIEKTGTTGAASDTALNILIEAISNTIDRVWNRRDPIVAAPVAVARIFTGSGTVYQSIDECVSITTVSVKESPTDSTYTDWTSSDYIPFSGDIEKPDFNHLPYTYLMTDPSGDYSVFTGGFYVSTPGFKPSQSIGRGVPTVQVTARWGYALQVPPMVKQTTIALAARYMKSGQSAWTDTLASPELGELMYQQFHSDIKFMLDNMRGVRPSIG